MKGRICIDGRKQQNNSVTGDATFPTVSMESVLIIGKIDAYEGHEFSICNILGAFLSEDMDKDAKIELCGRLA